MWLVTRPFVYLFKLVKTVLLAPIRLLRGFRRHRDHKQIKSLKKQVRAAR